MFLTVEIEIQPLDYEIATGKNVSDHWMTSWIISTVGWEDGCEEGAPTSPLRVIVGLGIGESVCMPALRCQTDISSH